jgi:hypothetical protein
MHRLFVILALASSIGLGPATAEAQPEAAQLLERSARAMDNLQSMRIAGVMEIRVDVARQEQPISLTMIGELQEPDRAHIFVTSPSMAVDSEVVVVGTQGWTRDSGGPWSESTSANLPFTSRASIGASSDQFSRFVRNPRVVDQGASYLVSGDLDVEAALGEGSSDLLSGLAMAQGFGLGESRVAVSIVLDKQTLYTTGFSMEMTIQVPDAQARSSVTIQMAFTFSDFNDPTISIQPPR